jgi:hypothetical protein
MRRHNNLFRPIIKLDICNNVQQTLKMTTLSPSPSIISSSQSYGKIPLFPEIKSPNVETFKNTENQFNFTPSPQSPSNDIINDMDEIYPHLWLGKLMPGNILIQNNFTHILSIIDKEPDFINLSNLIIKWINIKDDGNEHIEKYFDECGKFIHGALNNNGKIYVHCQYGLSRSPTIVIAYFIKYMHYDFDRALRYVSKKRPSICPNFDFNCALREYAELQN